VSAGIADAIGFLHHSGMMESESRNREIDAAALTAIHERWMRLALTQARAAAEEGEVPVGAVILRDGHLIAKARNQVETLKDPTAHAEILAITQAAAAVGDWRLTDCTLYVTKEPCVMCAGAIVLARIPLVVWGMTDPHRGGAVSLFNVLDHGELNHRCDHHAGVLEDECKGAMQQFFRALRSKPTE
jgi:tRNA(adenine34) deaminase